MKYIAILVLLLVAVYSTDCPNNCNSHGTCKSNGVCSCFKKSAGYDNDYVGYDCSKRINI